jgi:hypothetical protein
MSRPRTIPPAAVVNRLAVDWQTIAMHEAGHVVGALSVGLPVHEVWLGYREHSRWFGPSEWTIVGRTEVAPHGGTVAGHPDQAIVMILGGLVAEALVVARRDGRSQTSAWRLVTGKRANTEDVSDLRSWLRDRTATLTMGTADKQVRTLLRHQWSTVITVADALAERQHLRERDVRRLAGNPARSTRPVARAARGGAR